MLKLIHDGILHVHKSIRDIPGDDFMCIFFDDAYFLEVFKQ